MTNVRQNHLIIEDVDDAETFFLPNLPEADNQKMKNRLQDLYLKNKPTVYLTMNSKVLNLMLAIKDTGIMLKMLTR